MKHLFCIATFSLMFLAPVAEAKVCKGDPTAISRQHFSSGSFSHGMAVMTLGNGCKLSCVAGDSERKTKRHCVWS